MIVPTKDAPELAYVVESSAKQYVPDVIYKEKDDYGNQVSMLMQVGRGRQVDIDRYAGLGRLEDVGRHRQEGRDLQVG